LCPGNRARYRYWTPYCIEFHNIKLKPEIIGWIELITNFEKREEFRKFKSIGIIVDSELDKLKLYNNRTIPFRDNLFLPKRIQLIYASGERAPELFANKMLRIADKVSNICLDMFQSGKLEITKKKIANSPYSAMRYLKPLKH
jgi:hypothetical protein